jgi:regulator of replication initiation timing
VVHSKANRSEQAVTRELSKVLSIVIVFVAKNNRLRGRNRKKRQKVEESQKMKKKLTKKESAEETKKPAGKSIMIRLYPNKSQKEELNKWFGTARWTYNQVVALLRASPWDLSKYAVVKELRNDFVNKKNSNHEEKFTDKPWVTKTFLDIRDAALYDVVNAYTSNLAKENNNNFTIHFKKKEGTK